MSFFSGIGGLLGSMGRGIVGGIDQDAYDQTGGPLLGSILGDQPQTALPQAGLMAAQPQAQQAARSGLPQMSDLGRDLGAAGIGPGSQAAQQQDGQWKPDAATRRMMRSMFLQQVGAGVGAWGHGNTGGLADAMSNYRNDTLTMLLTQHNAKAAAQQQERQQQAMGGFTQDMQEAGDNEDLQRKTMLKWAPYLPPQSVAAMGGIIKDFTAPKQTPHLQTVPQADGSTKTYVVTLDKNNQPVMKEIPELAGQGKPQEMGDLHVNAAGVAVMPASIDGKPPQMVKFNVKDGTYSLPGANGRPDVPIDISQHTIIPAPKPSSAAPSEAANTANNAYSLFLAKHPTEAASIDQMTGAQRARAMLEWDTAKTEATAAGKPVNDEASIRILDNETNKAMAPFSKMYSDSDLHMQNLNAAQLALSQPNNAVAAGIAVPAFVKALIAGNGIRITQPELDQILHARGIVGDIDGYFNKLRGKGNLSDGQRTQMAGLLQDLQAKIYERLDTLRGGLRSIQFASSRNEALQASSDLRDALNPSPQQVAQKRQAQIQQAIASLPDGAGPTGQGPAQKASQDTYNRFIQAVGLDKEELRRALAAKHWY